MTSALRPRSSGVWSRDLEQLPCELGPELEGGDEHAGDSDGRAALALLEQREVAGVDPGLPRRFAQTETTVQPGGAERGRDVVGQLMPGLVRGAHKWCLPRGVASTVANTPTAGAI